MRPHYPACLLAALLCGCSVSVPTLLAPPFGPSDPPDAPRLFFPTGIAVTPSGWLLVNASNFDRTFDSGVMLSLSPAFIDSLYAGDPASIALADLPAEADPRHPVHAVMVPSFAGPIALDQSGTTAYTASRAANLVSAVTVDPASGELSCARGGGKDCRQGLVNTLTKATLEGPYGIAAGSARLPGDPTDHQVIFVSSLVAHVDSIVNSTLQTYGRVAALLTDQPGQLLYSTNVSSPVLASGVGAGPILFDGFRRQLILGGCYQRFGSSGSGEPSTSKCTLSFGQNPLRFVDVDSGADATVRVFDIAPAVRGNETTALVLGGEDQAGVPQVLYAVSRNPDVMLELLLPPLPGQDPSVRRVTELPLSPSGAIRLKRPAGQSGGDLIAVAGSGNASVSIYDAFQGLVVAQVNLPQGSPLQLDFPFALAQLPTPAAPSPDAGKARFVASIFGSCQLAFFDMDFAQPSTARLRSVAGKCQ